MHIQKYSVVLAVAALTGLLSINPAIAGKDADAGNKGGNATLDINEQTHLEFMCEEEKLARDVYITLGIKYPDSKAFGQIGGLAEATEISDPDKSLEVFQIKVRLVASGPVGS